MSARNLDTIYIVSVVIIFLLVYLFNNKSKRKKKSKVIGVNIVVSHILCHLLSYLERISLKIIRVVVGEL